MVLSLDEPMARDPKIHAHWLFIIFWLWGSVMVFYFTNVINNALAFHSYSIVATSTCKLRASFNLKWHRDRAGVVFFKLPAMLLVFLQVV